MTQNINKTQFYDKIRGKDLFEEPQIGDFSFSQGNLFMHNTVYITHSEEVRQLLLSKITMLCHHTWQTKWQINKKSIFCTCLVIDIKMSQ